LQIGATLDILGCVGLFTSHSIKSGGIFTNKAWELDVLEAILNQARFCLGFLFHTHDSKKQKTKRMTSQIHQSVKAHFMFNSSTWHVLILCFVVFDGVFLLLDMLLSAKNPVALFALACTVDVCIVILFVVEIWMIFIAYGKKYALGMIKLRLDAVIVIVAFANSS
jgi:hypothetical protein